jgi:Bacterial antitoxin of type II TA system, VapB
MRTTMDLPDELLDTARQLAAQTKTTVRELVIEGLSEVVEKRQRAAAQRYVMPDRSVDGQGLQPGIKNLHWDTIRDDDAQRHVR